MSRQSLGLLRDRTGPTRSNATTADHAQQDGNHSDHKQDMNQSSQSEGGHQAKEPKDDQDNRDEFEHERMAEGMLTPERVA